MSDYVTIPNASCVGETPGGCLIIVAGGERVLIPRALVSRSSEVSEPGQDGELVIPYDIAEEKGLDGLIEDE